MNEASLERARGLAYDSLGRWLSGAVDEALWQEVCGLFWPDAGGAFDADEEAARYQQLIGFNILPYASVYLEPEGQLGGAVSSDALAHYAGTGFSLPADASAPDHIAAELSYMHYLSGYRADALAAGATPAADRWGERFQLFLAHHALHWMPVFLLSLRRQGDDRYAVLADMLLEVVLDHHASLSSVPPAPHTRPAAPDILSRPDTGLKDIALYFTRPVWCGVFLGRDDIGRLGRSLTLPIGFGDRGQSMTNLLRAAVTYDRLPDLLAGLRYLIGSERFALEAIADAYASDTIAEAVQPWLIRMAGSIELIGRIESGAQGMVQSS